MGWVRVLLFLWVAPAWAADVLPLRERAAVEDGLLAERLEVLAPRLMREAGVDLWVLVAREYLDDPVMETMLDARNFTARRRTILVLFDPGGGKKLERLTVSRYGLGGLFEAAWDPAAEPDQWKRLAEVVAARDPQAIAVNVSAETAFADGLTKSQHDALMAALPDRYRGRVRPAGQLAVDWLSIRTPAEMERYGHVMEVARGIIAEGLSRAAVTPGVTTADDLEWWYRERIADAKVEPWFHPSVALFRAGTAGPLDGATVIEPGDLIWTDFGIVYLGLATDTQTLAYVLKPGERAAPAGLAAGLEDARAVAAILMGAFREGASGNDLLVAALAQAKARGIETTIYSHPIGTHGHGAGPAIGFWDDQRPGPRGEGPVKRDTAWSIELQATRAVPEWGGQKVAFRFEHDAFFDGREARFIAGEQEALILIPSD